MVIAFPWKVGKWDDRSAYSASARSVLVDFDFNSVLRFSVLFFSFVFVPSSPPTLPNGSLVGECSKVIMFPSS